jgi:hypothetical protein
MRCVLKCLLITGVLCGLSTNLHAESYRAESNVAAEPFTWLLYTYEHEAEFDADGVDGNVTLHETDLYATPLFTEAGAWQMAVGLGLKRTDFVFDEIELDDLDLYSVLLPLDLMYDTDDWMFWGNITPALFTDFEELSNDDYRTLFHGMAMYRWRSNVEFALGAAYDRQFGEDELYPMGGVVWRIGEEWELNLVLPMPRITYAPSRTFQLFADVRPEGDYWNVSDEDLDEEFDFRLEGFRAALGFEYRVAPHVWLHLAAGSAFERKYEIEESDARTFESDAEDTYFVRGGLVVR